jgi:hypothetical protein
MTTLVMDDCMEDVAGALACQNAILLQAPLAEELKGAIGAENWMLPSPRQQKE